MEMKLDVTAVSFRLCNLKHHESKYNIPKLPDEVDVWVVAVLSPSRVASREGAEEGVGEQTCHLLLRHSDGVVHASLEEGYRLGGGTEVQLRKVKII